MPATVPGIFARSFFSGGATRQTSQKSAASGFAQVFTTMLAHELHHSMLGEDSGPMGTSGGASGDIYGSLLDQAMGKALAKSKSMAGLTRMISRGLSGPRHPIASAFKDSLIKAQPSSSISTGSETGHERDGIRTVMGRVSQFGTPAISGSDARGPVLLPPAPTEMAPLLQPPLQ
ncbi:MAG TPA: rod-binding protein [Candidatus Binataceae bacterium]|nr:rod-binding protein [Candidatus Binataceae bacterium]